ncbi:MAG: undecaprenyl-diphosphate phosphatase [Elusimicrobiota bacterium]
MLDTTILGIVQGLTEFLPVSSSAHLVFIQSLLGWQQPELFFDIMLHMATLAAVLVFFRKEILNIAKGDWKYLFLLAAATVPTGIIGYLAKDYVETAFMSVGWAAVFLIITGFMLLAAQKYGRSFKSHADITLRDALIIGIIQGIAVLPGISRSGSTIAVAMLLGIEKTEAAKFAFLLSIPAILGAAALGLNEFGAETHVAAAGHVYGAVFAFVAGLFAIYLLMKVLVKNKLTYFSYYCWALGLIVLSLNFFK